MLKRFEFVYIFANTLAFVILVQGTEMTNKSYSTCTACMAEVLDLERQLMLNLQEYKEKMQYNFKLIRFSVNQLQRIHKESELGPEGYLSNPLKAFALIRRMHSDWNKWLGYMKKPANKNIDFIEAIQYKMPTSLDLQEARAGIIRIQNTYQMKAGSISRGILNGKQYEKRLSAFDCFAIGEYLFNETKYVSALDWLNASLDHYTDYDKAMSDIFDVDKINIWKSIAISQFEMGDYNALLNTLSMALKFKSPQQNLLHYLKNLQDFVKCSKLCRGEIQQESKLSCRYNSTTTPFLKLAPLKMEEISIDPYIVLYHDIIFDSEIKELKRTSASKFTRSVVGINGTINPSRTAQIMCLDAKDKLVEDRINQRLFDMSGLFLSKEENLQIINYGIGGHYQNHYDYIPTILEKYEDLGNRIASVLIYLNDVEKGGGTAFVAVKKVIYPKKGTAILWHHLDNSGNGISKTLHASCPVLVGSKWVALRFIHYYPQLFIKPCYK